MERKSILWGIIFEFPLFFQVFVFHDFLATNSYTGKLGESLWGLKEKAGPFWEKKLELGVYHIWGVKKNLGRLCLEKCRGFRPFLEGLSAKDFP